VHPGGASEQRREGARNSEHKKCRRAAVQRVGEREERQGAHQPTVRVRASSEGGAHQHAQDVRTSGGGRGKEGRGRGEEARGSAHPRAQVQASSGRSEAGGRGRRPRASARPAPSELHRPGRGRDERKGEEERRGRGEGPLGGGQKAPLRASLSIEGSRRELARSGGRSPLPAGSAPCVSRKSGSRRR
jgi:hypothetical protein